MNIIQSSLYYHHHQTSPRYSQESSQFCVLCEFYEAPALCSVLFESKITVPLYLKYSTRCEHIITQSWRVKNNGALRTSTNALKISIPGRNIFFLRNIFKTPQNIDAGCPGEQG